MGRTRSPVTSPPQATFHRTFPASDWRSDARAALKPKHHPQMGSNAATMVGSSVGDERSFADMAALGGAGEEELGEIATGQAGARR